MNTVKPPVQVLTCKLDLPGTDIFYPVVSGLADAAVQWAMNKAIVDLMKTLIQQQGYYEYAGSQVTGWYELKANERGVLSLSIGNYTYHPHSAHGLTIIKSLTFDTDTGFIYGLKDLFKNGSDYVHILSENIRIQIAERSIPLLDGFDGIRPDQDYYIADKSLVVYFQQYEITPYYIGLPMFPVSVFKLQDIAVDTGPVGRMATND